MLADLGERSTETGLDVRGIVRLFGALQSNGFASGVYLHPAMTNHSCRCVCSCFCCVLFVTCFVCLCSCVCECVDVFVFAARLLLYRVFA